MLERRGIAGCIAACVGTSFIALAATIGGFPPIISSAVTVTAGLWTVSVVLASCALALLLYRSFPHGQKISPFASRRPMMLVADEEENRPSDEELADIGDMVRMLGDAVLLARDVPSLQRIETLDVPALVSQTIAQYKDSRLRLAAAPSAPFFALADPGALQRAIDILITHALASASRVSVRLDHGTTALVVVIDDNGPGIPRANRESVFEARYYIETPPSQRASRSVELVTARQIVRALSGDITVSASPDGGGRFTLKLPLSQTHEAGLQAAS